MVRTHEPLSTQITSVRPLAGVGANVTPDVGRIGKRFAAEITTKRLLPAVCARVKYQMAGLGEPLAAQSTVKWYFAGVGTPVNL